MHGGGNGELGRLSNGETLLIDRRRRGLNQADAAASHGIGRAVYSRWELDLSRGPRVRLGRLRPHERCLLYRRRAGTTQGEVAEALEVSRYWINQMEVGRASCDPLLWYWEQ